MLAIGSDHGGYELKEEIKKHLADIGVAYEDFGTDSEASCDYPLFAEKVCGAVQTGKCERGILICGTGIGVSIAANKIAGIRAALVAEPHGAALARRHNDANVLCFGAGSVGLELASSCLEAFLAARFEGDRHQRRLDRIAALEGRPGGLGE